MASSKLLYVGIDGIAPGGTGITTYEGKRVFVEFAAPGDIVCCQIKKDYGSWAEAEIIEVLEPSPERVEPVCPYYGLCGGCTLQHLDYEAQVDAKIGVVRETFKRIGGIALSERMIRLRRDAPFEYRNKMQFHKAEGNHLAFRERKSRQLVVVEDCPVADIGIREAMREKKLRPPLDKNRFAVFSSKKTFLCESGTEQGMVSILGRELITDVRVFFQSNVVMLEMLIKDLIEAAADADRSLRLVDIYCGVGTFAYFLGGEILGNPGFSEIDLVEENKYALNIAIRNMQSYKKVNYYAVSDSDWSKTQKKERKWGLMILDPPRKGLSFAISEFIAWAGPDLVAYVSCDPATLARDSRILLKGGYTLKELTMYDFYPQTAHIESLAVFCRRKK